MGSRYRVEEMLALLSGGVMPLDSVARDACAQLVADPMNPVDPQAVAVWVEGRHVGYLPAAVAPRYFAVFAAMQSAGQVATVPANLWARPYDDYVDQPDGSVVVERRCYTRVSVALAEPEMVRPLNMAPPRPRAELPVGSSVKITHIQDHLAHLGVVLRDRPAGWVHATLHRGEPATPRSTRPVVEVRVSGYRAGTLTPQMSETYLPLVDHLAAAGTVTVGRVLLEGSPVSVVAALHAVRPHEVTADWLAAATAP